MKFGKQLDVNSNIEWREHYVQYKRLKRMIKRVVFEMERVEKQSKITGETSRLLEDQDAMVEVQAAKQDFWALIEENFHTVNTFYRGRILSLSKCIKQLESDGLTASHGHVHAPKDLERGFAKMQQVYDELVDLKEFVQLNHSGFRKIVKKFDKSCHLETLSGFLKKLDKEPFFVSKDTDVLIDRLFKITSRDKLKAGNIERRLKQDSGSTDLLRKVRRTFYFTHLCLDSRRFQVKPVPFSCAIVIFFGLLLTPVLDEAMLVGITTLWVTEAIPYFATALLVPPLVVFLQILDDPEAPGTPLSSHKASKEVMSRLVNHTTILIMGGYAISAAFVKCQIELYIAAALQHRFKKSPKLFLLAIMMMGLFLSMWISNHTAPVLCVSVLLPILRDFPTHSAYVKTLLIGLAFACNLGGMMTPIASLQNTLAVSFLEKAGYEVTFGQWMLIATPFCTIATILCWLYLIWQMQPNDAQFIPQIVYDQSRKVDRVHVVVIILTLVTIGMWATFSLTSTTFGDLGIISLLFMVVMFGTGILSQFDFNSFSWHILFLIGGGNVLGDAVQRSGLLTTLSSHLIDALPSGSVWLVTLCLCLLVIALTTFVSHTVASIILLPIIVNLSVQIGHPHIPVISCALSISAAMALPFSSFPNINSLLVLDDHGRPYLEVVDFLRVGVGFSLITVFLIVTLGFFLIVSVLGYSTDALT